MLSALRLRGKPENRTRSGRLAVLADDPTTLTLGEPTPHTFTLACGE